MAELTKQQRIEMCVQAAMMRGEGTDHCYLEDQQQQQQGGVSPMQAYNTYQKFAAPAAAAPAMPAGAATGGGGGMAAGAGTGAGQGAAMGAQAAMANAGAGAGAGSGAGGGAMVAAAPWVGLAAVIAGNEIAGRKDGRRSSNNKEYAKELLSGAVGFQDGEAIADELGPIGAPMEDLSRFGEKWSKKLQPWEWF